MDEQYQSISMRIQQLITTILELNQLLIQDQSYFSKKEYSNLDSSNSNKQKLLIQLQDEVIQLHELIPIRIDGTKPTLSQYIQSLEQSKGDQIQSMLKSLYSALIAGYQHLIANNGIVTENLNFLNQIFSRLSRLVDQNTGVYDKPTKK